MGGRAKAMPIGPYPVRLGGLRWRMPRLAPGELPITLAHRSLAVQKSRARQDEETPVTKKPTTPRWRAQTMAYVLAGGAAAG